MSPHFFLVSFPFPRHNTPRKTLRINAAENELEPERGFWDVERSGRVQCVQELENAVNGPGGDEISMLSRESHR